MNKTELVDRIALKTQISKQIVEEVLNETFNAIKKTIKKGETVTLVGFGTFAQTHRKARAGHNPFTGQKMEIPAMTLPRFKPGKEFRELLT